MSLFNDLPSTPLVKAESVEMLQAIEHGYKVTVLDLMIYGENVLKNHKNL